jgi:hypothetical protein
VGGGRSTLLLQALVAIFPHLQDIALWSFDDDGISSSNFSGCGFQYKREMKQPK